MLTDAAALTSLRPAALWRAYGDAVITGAFKLVAALVILIVGMWAARRIAEFVRQLALKNPRMDVTLSAFIASIVRYGILIIVGIAVLDQFGVQTTQIIAVLGAATLAIGLALQGTLSNVAAGVMLILFRPYKLGDFIEVAGQKGSVKDINLFITELASPDNVKITLPNGQCWGAPILNFTANGKRMITLKVGVAYDSDLDKAVAAIETAIAADPRVLDPPNVRVESLGDFAVGIAAMVWCQAPDLIELKFALTRKIKDALDAAGVEIPYPTTVTRHFDAGPLP